MRARCCVPSRAIIGEKMLCCLPAPIPDNATVQQTKLLRILRLLTIAQLVLAVLTLIVDIWEGIIMMLGAAFLWCVTCGKNWCTCVIYILLCIMDGLMCIIAVGNYFSQNSQLDTAMGIILFITLLKLPFYMVSVFYTFLAYRELKALFIDAMNNPQAMAGAPSSLFGGGWGGGMGGMGGPPQGYQQDYQPPQAPQQPPSYQPFAGAGYRVG